MSSSGRSRQWPAGADATPWMPSVIDMRPESERVPAESEPDPVAEAYALGFSQGRQEGERAERARLGPAVRAAEEAVAAINDNDSRWTGAVEENLVTLSLAIARHLIDREVEADNEIVRDLITRALAAFPVDQPVQLRVHPDDLVIIRTLRAEQPRREDRQESMMSWIGDPRISRGGCIVEGRERIVDGRVETALERVYRRLSHQQHA